MHEIIESLYEDQQFFYHSNHLGSTSWITDAGGNADQHLQYLPFGELLVDQRPAGNDIRFKFTGKERDSETGFDYFGARYYQSDLSIWLSVDPLSDERPSHSPYNYCQLNPVMRVDPTGMLDGDYYSSSGTFLFNDGIDDNRVYVEHAIAPPSFSSEIDGASLGTRFDYVGDVEETKLTFTGNASANNSAQADGTLNIIQVLENGDEYTRASFDAVGGPWGNGSPENGDYSTSNLTDRGPNSNWPNAGMTVDGIGFSLNLDPLFDTNRSLLRIHPDGGNYFGTQGCIGLTGSSTQLTVFRDLIENVLEMQTSIPTSISILGNPNNNGTNNTISNGE